MCVCVKIYSLNCMCSMHLVTFDIVYKRIQIYISFVALRHFHSIRTSVCVFGVSVFVDVFNNAIITTSNEWNILNAFKHSSCTDKQTRKKSYLKIDSLWITFVLETKKKCVSIKWHSENKQQLNSFDLPCKY